MFPGTRASRTSTLHAETVDSIYGVCPPLARSDLVCPRLPHTGHVPTLTMLNERQNIIDSVFSRRNAQGVPDEVYVSHLKIWEDADASKKLRYILLSRMSYSSRLSDSFTALQKQVQAQPTCINPSSIPTGHSLLEKHGYCLTFAVSMFPTYVSSFSYHSTVHLSSKALDV